MTPEMLQYVIGILTAAIVALWVVQRADAAECKKDRARLTDELLNVKVIVGAARFCNARNCAVRDQLIAQEEEKENG